MENREEKKESPNLSYKLQRERLEKMTMEELLEEKARVRASIKDKLNEYKMKWL